MPQKEDRGHNKTSLNFKINSNRIIYFDLFNDTLGMVTQDITNKSLASAKMHTNQPILNNRLIMLIDVFEQDPGLITRVIFDSINSAEPLNKKFFLSFGLTNIDEDENSLNSYSNNCSGFIYLRSTGIRKCAV